MLGNFMLVEGILWVGLMECSGQLRCLGEFTLMERCVVGLIVRLDVG